MIGLFEMKYMNICLVAGVILELIALVAILNLYINIRRRERRQKNREDGEDFMIVRYVPERMRRICWCGGRT